MERICKFNDFLLEAKAVMSFNKDVLNAETKEAVKKIYPNAKFFIGKTSHFFGELENNLFFKAYYKKHYKNKISGDFKIVAVYTKKNRKFHDLYREPGMTEDFVPAGFSNITPVGSTPTGRAIETGYDMKAIAGKVNELCNSVSEQAKQYHNDENPSHTAESYLKEVKNHVCSKIDEACDLHENVNEADDYEFEPGAAVQRLKQRQDMNLKRYRAAQQRKDNFAIKLYELRIKMDKVDAERIKIQNAIHELKKKFKK